MKAPDKCYITREKNGVVYSLSFNDNGGLEYIRKDALVEWAKEKQYESLTIVADNFWQEVIDKIQSL